MKVTSIGRQKQICSYWER